MSPTYQCCPSCVAGETCEKPTPAPEFLAVPEPPEPDVLTVDQAAAFLRIGRRQLYEAIGKNEVPHRRIGRIIRLSRSALVRWLDGSCGAASKRSL